MRALELAIQVLAPGGSFVAKIFQGGDFQLVKKAIAERFAQVRVVRPQAVRRESIEVFLCGTGFQPLDEEPAEPTDPD